MPQEFTGNIDTPLNLKFGADEYVDSSSNADMIRAAAEGFERASTSLVLGSFKKATTDEIQKQEDYYTESRRLKRAAYEAAVVGDEATEMEYTKRLEELKIAERQGAISGTNSQIRQDALLRSYVNRFPHLEEQFRTAYSRTRADAQAARAQFEDPIETGIDELLKRATSAGRSVSSQLEYEQLTQQMELAKKEMDYRAAVGVSLQSSVDTLVDKQFRHGAAMDVRNWTGEVLRFAEQSGREVSGEELKADLALRKSQFLGGARQMIIDSLARGAANVGEERVDAILSPEYLDGKMRELGDIYDSQTAYLDSLDSLKKAERTSELLKYKTLDEIGKASPLLNFFVKVAPEQAVDTIMKNWDRNKKLFLNGGAAMLETLKQNSVNFDAEVIDFQLKMMMGYMNDGRQQARDFSTVIERGGALPSTGYPMVDAARLNATVNTVLSSPEAANGGFDEQTRANAINSAVETEKTLDGDYVTPSAVFYKDPIRAKELRTNQTAKENMTTSLDAGMVTLQGMLSEEEGTDLIFAPNPENERGPNPWTSYSTGGPWASKGSTKPSMGRASQLSGTANARVDEIVRALNNDYWNWRNMYGAADAERRAGEVFKIIDEQKQAAADAEGAEVGDDGVATFDLTD